MIDYKNFNWGILIVLILTILLWYSIFTIGFLVTLTWLIIIAAIIGIIIRLYENRY